MSAAVPREKRHSLAIQRAENVRVRWFSKRRDLRNFMHVGKTGHGVQPAAPNDSNFRLRQESSLNLSQMMANGDYTNEIESARFSVSSYGLPPNTPPSNLSDVD